MKRLIGIRHRVKKTAAGEARPTELCVLVDGSITLLSLKLETETNELDWVMGRFPVSWRATTPGDDLSKFSKHHIKWRPLKDDENSETMPKNLLRQEKKVWMFASKVPSKYEGLKAGDTVVMMLGGSGDALASAISRRGETINAKAFRIPPSTVKLARDNDDKDNDSALLVKMFKDCPEIFYQVLPRDRKMIWLVNCYRARMEAMRQRIKCEQRIFAGAIGRIFASPEGEFPDGTIEECFEDLKANDPILQSLIREENGRKAELEKTLEELPVYTEILQKVEGLGPSISSRIVAAIQDIRRFPTIAGFKAFCGVHVLPDGRFPRQRHGEVANWHPDPRQAFFLVADQFNRRPATEWGQKLLENKRKLREKHPEVVTNGEGKKKYTDGHIHKMGMWRTSTRFAEWLYREWKKLEAQTAQKASAD